MHAVSVHSYRHIHPVVDKKLCTELAGNQPELFGQREKLPHRKVLLPKLNGTDTAHERLPDGFRKRYLRHMPVGDEVEIKIEIHCKVNIVDCKVQIVRTVFFILNLAVCNML